MSHLPTIFAYLDPGVGAMMLQAALAGLFGALITIKMWWGKVTGIFRRKPPTESSRTLESSPALKQVTAPSAQAAQAGPPAEDQKL